MTNVHPPVTTGGTASETAGNGGSGAAQAGTGASGTLGTGGAGSGNGATANGGTSGTLGVSPTGGTMAGGGRGAGGRVSTGGRRAMGGATGSAGATSMSGGAGMNAAGAIAAGGSGGSAGGTNPLPVTDSPYKGVANSPAAQLSALGSTWCYNWGTAPKSTDCNDPYFVPMIWGSDNVASALQGIAKAGYKTVLGFNEPNKSDQSSIAVADAIALWPQLTSNADIRVGSPAVSDDGRSWLEDFMKQVKSKGLRVDFIAMHWYGWNAGSCTASQFEGAVNWASQWGLPVWVTEWGCMGSSNPDEQTVLDFYKSAITMLAKHPLVERYAWYPWNTYNKLYDDSGKITALGQAFAAAPQYRP